MRTLNLVGSALLTSLLIGCDQPANGAESTMKQLSSTTSERVASSLSVTLEVLKNFQGVDGDLRQQCKRAGGIGAKCSTYRMSLNNIGAKLASGQSGWNLYFHSIRRNLVLLNSDAFALEHVKGDLHRLVPTAQFPGLAKGQTLQLDILIEERIQFESDFMPRFFIADDAGNTQVIANTDSETLSDFVRPIISNDPLNWKHTADDGNTLASAASRYQSHTAAGTPVNDGRARIIPKPLSSTPYPQAPLSLTAGIRVAGTVLAENSHVAIQHRLQQLNLTETGDAAYPVDITIQPETFDEAIAGSYRLDARGGGATIIGFDQAGAFYGMQSLLSLVDAKQRTLTLAHVEDAPRFQYRGMFLDVARNFHSKEVVLKLLEQMSVYKLNRFHFHLSDDEGWRLEIPGLPELTEVGGKRCFDLSEKRCLLPQLGSGPDNDNFGSGFYTMADYIEIVRYAAARHIEVIPEFDTPAHARAAIVAMEARHQKYQETAPDQADEFRLIDPEDSTDFLSVQFYNDSYVNPCIESSYQFVAKLVREVQQMHKTAGAPLTTWHFGGDEAINLRAFDSFEDAPGTDPEKGDVAAASRQQPWSGSPQCQRLVENGTVDSIEKLGNYFATRVSKIVSDAGIPTMGAWYDGLKNIENPHTQLSTRDNYINSWAPAFGDGGDKSHRLASRGFGVVQSHSDHLYFDMPYEMDPKENGYYWASRNSDTRKVFGYSPLNTPQLAEVFPDADGKPWEGESPGADFSQSVVGIQGQLWSETTRTDEMVEYKIFPRLLALAERAWHKATWEIDPDGQVFNDQSNRVDTTQLADDWLMFSAALGNKELYKLDLGNVGYRVPVPGAVVEAGILKVATPYPGLPVEYFDGREWQPVTQETAPESIIGLRARSADGKRASRSVEL
ncbi:family 20 glycosylhydrolase [uncultured Microbulbifer sp.]|uniref:family 20 glycosylhydrolase n=1 Tax=uncultured Microbulbifer sp. TaxID=348147 RepID=UPI00261C70D4|nr:family 20 glycosylhydrolase [uncultured Microbulbifer sp.]